ncbi:MAG: hypothetical protein LAT65_10405 [Saccharospirillum sp.]|nr:hypothetical protein [Saccharospirillum sp.]
MNAWLLAAILNLMAALVHIGIIVGGPGWYRFFGSGERMAIMAERKHPWPAILTSTIALALAVASAYCLALGGYLGELPLMWWVGVLLTAIYTLRGILPLVAMAFARQARTPFLLWSSLICGGIAVVHWLAWV